MFRIARTVTTLVVALPILGAFGCGKILGIPNDPTFDSEPSGGGGTTTVTAEDLPENWRCILDEPVEATAAASANVQVTMCPFGAASCSPPVTDRMTAKVCGRLGCIFPLVDDLVTQNGTFDFNLNLGEFPTGFDGFLEIQGPDAHCNDAEAFATAAGQALCDSIGCVDMDDPEDETCFTAKQVPTLFYFNPPITGDSARFVNITPTWAADLITLNAGAQALDDTGWVAAAILDCNNERAAGVEFTVSSKQYHLAYIQDDVFDESLTETTASGSIGIFDVAKGFATINAKVNGIVVSTVSITVKPDATSFLVMTPTSLLSRDADQDESSEQ